MPPDSQRVDYEGELAVVIGRPCRDVPEARARDVVLGYTVANDVTARDLQQADGQWTRAKGYDSFCPLGPWIETTVDPGDLAIRTELDGEVRQDSRTHLLLHPVEELIAYISRVMTLLPGDVILTGTPAGVGPMTVGPAGQRHRRGHRHADQPRPGAIGRPVPWTGSIVGTKGRAQVVETAGTPEPDWVSTMADEVIEAAARRQPHQQDRLRLRAQPRRGRSTSATCARS